MMLEANSGIKAEHKKLRNEFYILTISLMRYNTIRELDISNGRGVGISLFVQGCHFHCKGCFNQETWDFNGGKEWNEEIENTFINLANKPFIKRISFLGGEPLCDENVETVKHIIQHCREKYGSSKCIWLYTGYTFDDIIKWKDKSKHDNLRFETIKLADFAVDGRFEIENQDLYNEYIVFAGSTNQNVIEVKERIKNEDSN